jgi:hypothetical protein
MVGTRQIELDPADIRTWKIAAAPRRYEARIISSQIGEDQPGKVRDATNERNLKSTTADKSPGHDRTVFGNRDKTMSGPMSR